MSSLPVTGGLTDSQLRASPVPVSISTGVELEIKNDTGSPLAISASSLPLPNGASTESTLALIKAKTDNLDVLLSTRTKPADTQNIAGSVSISNFPATQNVAVTSAVEVEIKNDSGSPIPVSGTFFQATQPISASSLPLPSGAATSALQTQPGVDIGDVTINNAAGASAVNIQDGGNSLTVDGSVSISGSVAVTGPLTDTQLRASAVPVTGPIVVRTTDEQTLTGVYYYHGGANVVQVAADAATAGRFWIINPLGSTITVRIKSIEFASQLGSAQAVPTSPRITIERVSFTGTASGASLSPAKRKTADANPQSSLRTASTGLTLTAGNVIVSFLPVASATAVGYTNTAVEKWKPDVNDRIELIPGEGIVCRQPDAGSTGDLRRYTIDVSLEEF